MIFLNYGVWELNRTLGFKLLVCWFIWSSSTTCSRDYMATSLILGLLMQDRMLIRWKQLLIFSTNQPEFVYFALKRGPSFKIKVVLFSCCEQNCTSFHLAISADFTLSMLSKVSSPSFFSPIFLKIVQKLCCRYEIKLREQQDEIRNQRKSQVW